LALLRLILLNRLTGRRRRLRARVLFAEAAATAETLGIGWLWHDERAGHE
jgi:hypothetical protein